MRQLIKIEQPGTVIRLLPFASGRDTPFVTPRATRIVISGKPHHFTQNDDA